MKKNILKMVIAFVTMLYCNLIIAQVTVSGYVYLDHKTNHQNTKLQFVRTAPSSLTYSFYTDAKGYFSGSIQTGVYNITYSKTGYYSINITDKQLFSNNTLTSDTLKVNLCGSLSDTIYKGTYNVNCNIGVAKGKTLVIQPGTKLIFAENIEFDINGLLIAEGTKTDSIIFTSTAPYIRWGGINFHDKADDNSKLSYSLIEWSVSCGISIDTANITLSNLTIRNNIAQTGDYHWGAGIYLNHSSPIISNIFVVGNECYAKGTGWEGGGSYGGGICCYNYSSPSITNTIISNNSSALNGGGIACIFYSSPTINEVIISNNSAINTISGGGGGVYCYVSSNPILTNVNISQNSSIQNGGGIYIETTASPTIKNSKINNNSALQSGGGIYCVNYSHPSLTNCKISNNSASVGAGIYCYASYPTLTNLVITKNIAKDYGGGIYCTSYSGSKSHSFFRNLTIDNNSASKGGGGICCDTLCVVTNCVVTNNTGTGIYSSATVNISYCNVWNNSNGNFSNCGQWIGTNVITNTNGNACDMYYNIQEEPMFENAGSGNYLLHSGSPLIDAGINDSVKELTDINGQARIWDGDKNGTSIVDMGAYEVGLNLGNDITACSSAILVADIGYFNYNWNNGLSNNDTLIVNTSGKYYIAVTNSNSYISYDTIDVTINSLPTINLGSDTILCSSLTLDAGNFTNYKWNNASTSRYLEVSNSGKFSVTVTDNNSCKNSDTINITINPTYHNSSNQKICNNDSLLWQGKYYKIAGQYFANYTSINGCDSIYELHVTTTTVDTLVVQNGITLTANATSAVYQWIKCISNEIILGETAKKYTATENNSYAVVITQNNCSDTSSCFNIISVGLADLNNFKSILIYPNPTSNSISINGKGIELIEITNIEGQIIEKIKTSKENYNIDLSSHSKGIYFIKIVTNKETINRQIILE